jgi:hypothetical protein
VHDHRLGKLAFPKVGSSGAGSFKTTVFTTLSIQMSCS